MPENAVLPWKRASLEVVDRDLLTGFLSEGLSLAEIGRRLGRHESAVAYWLETHGLRAAHAERHIARGALTREQLEPLVAAGMSIAELAKAVDRSKGTVRHWLRRYGMQTWSPSGSRRRAESAAAHAQGLRDTIMMCARHGETGFVIDGRGYYRCRRCRAESVVRRRRKVKATLVAEAGGRCRLCGYADSMRALQFHHLDPAEKRLEMNSHGVALAIDTLRAEAQKCVLLCSNCHAELEDRLHREPSYRPDFSDT